ncbi:HutD family protein [Streptomyces sp. RerS4]|uniref:HutD/Ves family protein n=1 Tax=Streptomyces sp. RerS4 TaxID=2942449 RepID=UPI00201C273C|nr:HutD family protein [Streptomyces sp. RerS4]UQX04370.1 HutD family protein [Streptomyces sp. RerS4]
MSSGPADLRILRAAERAATPWKNGGGVTREIAAHPEGAGTVDFAWRVSLAEVAVDGPFSEFPGVDRTLTLAEGAGMDLTIAGEPRRLDERYVPRHFPGDRPTDCRLVDGPVVNFNVMYRRGSVEAHTAVVRGEFALTVLPGETLLLVALDGPAVLSSYAEPSGGRVELGPYDAALLAASPVPQLVHTEGRAAVVRFRKR